MWIAAAACVLGLVAPGALGAGDLVFDPDAFQPREAVLDSRTVRFRAVEGAVYVRRPVDARYQSLNVYVPEGYFAGATIHGYTRDTAPIFLPNSVGGYMPGLAQRPGQGMDRIHNTLLHALEHGYVVVAPGARGRTLRGPDGRFTGKAPAAIVDLKAAVRYVRFNQGRIPGDANRIVSNGTSAGGALSSLLGATGGHPDYEPYLEALGAAPARDDVWAVSAYCPITNLEHADMAYEWLLSGVNESKAFGRGPGPRPPAGGAPEGPGAAAGSGPYGQPQSSASKMTPTQIANAAALKAAFADYVNGLGLRTREGRSLTLSPDGTGPFRDHAAALLVESARSAQASGADVAKTPWVRIRDGEVAGIDWDGFVRTVGRMKPTSAFDGAELNTGENGLFGDADTDAKHFTAFGAAHSAVPGARRADARIVRMMNPMAYLGVPGARTAKLWRIRHGAIDRDTSIAIPILLSLALERQGCSVDLALPWNTPHAGDYDLDDLFAWIDRHARGVVAVRRRAMARPVRQGRRSRGTYQPESHQATNPGRSTHSAPTLMRLAPSGTITLAPPSVSWAVPRRSFTRSVAPRAFAQSWIATQGSGPSPNVRVATREPATDRDAPARDARYAWRAVRYRAIPSTRSASPSGSSRRQRTPVADLSARAVIPTSTMNRPVRDRRTVVAGPTAEKTTSPRGRSEKARGSPSPSIGV